MIKWVKKAQNLRRAMLKNNCGKNYRVGQSGNILTAQCLLEELTPGECVTQLSSIKRNIIFFIDLMLMIMSNIYKKKSDYINNDKQLLFAVEVGISENV